MLKVEINEKLYNIPTSFEELTLEQYCKMFYKLQTSTDDMDEDEKFRLMIKNEGIILSRLMGEDDDFCLNLPMTTFQKIVDELHYIYDTKSFFTKAKASVKIKGKRHQIPPLDKMSMRQYIDADVVMQEETPTQYIELLSVLLLEKDDNGEFIPYKGDYIEKMAFVKDLPCSEALPLVFHFFKIGNAYKKLSAASMKVEEKLLPHNTQGS